MGQEVSRERKQLRASVALAVRYGAPSAPQTAEGICLNLSRSGMFLGTSRPLAPGSLLKVDCETADATDRIRGVARVVWVRTEAAGEHRPAGMGLRFLNLEAGSEKLIDGILQRGDIGTAGRRARSVPPDGPSGPRLVSVAPMREVREERPRVAPSSRPSRPGAAVSSTPPPPASPLPPRPAVHALPSSPPASGERRARATNELRERLGRTRRFTKSDPPPPSQRPEAPDGRGLDRSTEPEGTPTPPPRAAQPEPPTADGSVGQPAPVPPEARRTRTGQSDPAPQVEPRPEPVPQVQERPQPGAAPRRGTPGKLDLERMDDPAWRAQRLAELVEAEAARNTQDKPRQFLPAFTNGGDAEVEEAVIEREGPRLGKLVAPAVLLAVIGLAALGGYSWYTSRSTGASSRTITPPKVVAPAATAAAPAPEAPGSAQATTTAVEKGENELPKGIDVPNIQDDEGSDEGPRTSRRERNDEEKSSQRRAHKSSRKEASAKAPTNTATPEAAKTPAAAERSAAETPKEEAPGTAPPAAPAVATRPPAEAGSTTAGAPTPDATPSPAPDAPGADDDRAAKGNDTPHARASACLKRGDSACAVRELEGRARTSREWELLIESYRAVGQAGKAESRMRAYLVQFPNGKRAPNYRRILGLPSP